MSAAGRLAVETAPTDPAPRRDPGAKLQHIDACLGDAIEYCKTTGLERYEFVNQALPEVSLAALDLSITLFGKRLGAPLMIAPMTGGTERARVINRRLARAAERWRLPMGAGSQRLAVENPDRARYFRLRDLAPSTVLIACGGLRNGIDLAKALALGADLGAMAQPFLLKAHEGEEALDAFIADTLDELRVCMFGVGAAEPKALRGTLAEFSRKSSPD